MRNKPLLLLEGYDAVCDYSSAGRGGPTGGFPERDRVVHGQLMASQWRAIWAEHDANVNGVAVNSNGDACEAKGEYVDFTGKAKYDLKVKSLESLKYGIFLSNISVVGTGDNKAVRATVYVPEEKRDVIGKKIEEYATKDTKYDKPKNNDLISSIETIEHSTIESLWSDRQELMPIAGGVPVWCEVWLTEPERPDDLWGDGSINFDKFKHVASMAGITVKDRLIKFPGRSVCLALASREQLESVMKSVGCLAEIKRAKEVSDYFVTISNHEQTDWVRSVLDRVVINSSSNVSLCLLDTGVNNRHALLSPILNDKDCLSVDDNWGPHDLLGHGTNMAGVSAYGDLSEILAGMSEIRISHCLESVKILPNVGHNEPDLYGYITQQAISKAEINKPDRKRISCMAITAQANKDVEGGRPSSWSAAVDKIAAGERAGAGASNHRRLLCVSAGNVAEIQNYRAYPASNIAITVEDPAQAWNALTVGAFTEKLGFGDGDGSGGRFMPLAQRGELSPFSSTTVTWAAKWPIKPDVVFEGGNVLKDISGDYLEGHESVSLISTSKDQTRSQFEAFWGTSAATALAGRLAAELQARYPGLSPETIRGLMIHSARWTPKMIEQFRKIKRYDGSRPLQKGDYAQLLRIFGYGEPDLEIASYCASNALTMIAESEMQPFKQNERKDVVLNEMAVFQLPWPKDELYSMNEKKVSLRITLSYFIEPSPGSKNVGFSSRYRYPSHGFRFCLKKPTESYDEFQARINASARNVEDFITGDSGSERWTIGSQARDVGSIHSDMIEGRMAREIADCDMIGVYPVGGWWKDRPHLGCFENKAKYSLIVSLETDETEFDIYTPVANKIHQPIVTTVDIAAA